LPQKFALRVTADSILQLKTIPFNHPYTSKLKLFPESGKQQCGAQKMGVLSSVLEQNRDLGVIMAVE
jgi:hypothetical protein